MECGINNFRCPIDVCVSFDELQNKADFFKDLKSVLQGVLDVKTNNVFTSKVGILDIMNKPGFLRCSFVSLNFAFILLLPHVHKFSFSFWITTSIENTEFENYWFSIIIIECLEFFSHRTYIFVNEIYHLE